MSELSCGERYLRCLTGQSVDRVPYGVGLGWQPWVSTLDRWKQEAGNAALDVVREFGFDQSVVRPAVHYGIFPTFEYKVIEESKDFIVARNERGIVTRNRRDYGSMPEFLDYPVKTEDDWERLKAERLDPRAAGRVAEDWPAFRSRLRETGEAVQVGEFPWGVFGTPRDLLGVEQLLVDFHERPALVQNMMDHLTGLWVSLLEQVAEQVPIGQIHIWEDMSGRNGSLMSPRMVRQFMMPCYRRIAAFARRAGVRVVSVDTDGDCHELVPIMMENGVNTFYPFEVQAGNDIRDYRRQYPTLGILGGLDKRALAAGRLQVDGEIARAAAMCGQGRYIPGFDHLIPPDASWDNYAYAAREMKKVCYQFKGA